MNKTLLVNRQAEKHLKAINSLQYRDENVFHNNIVVSCPSCSSTNVYKDGFDLNPYRQRYECRACGQVFYTEANGQICPFNSGPGLNRHQQPERKAYSAPAA